MRYERWDKTWRNNKKKIITVEIGFLQQYLQKKEVTKKRALEALYKEVIKLWNPRDAVFIP